MVRQRRTLRTVSIDDAAGWTYVNNMWKRYGSETANRGVSKFFTKALKRHGTAILEDVGMWIQLIDGCHFLTDENKRFFSSQAEKLLDMKTWKIEIFFYATGAIKTTNIINSSFIS